MKNNLTGKKFHRLTVLGDDGTRTKGKKIKWLCECECGNRIHSTGDNLQAGRTKSCGCLNAEIRRFEDLTGFENEYIKVVQHVGTSSSQKARWACVCKTCGNSFIADAHNLKRYKSCGCLPKGANKEYLDSIRNPKSKWDDNLYKTNTTGVRGVSWNEKQKKFIASIGAKGKKIYLGSFETIEEAKEARKSAEKMYWR